MYLKQKQKKKIPVKKKKRELKVPLLKSLSIFPPIINCPQCPTIHFHMYSYPEGITIIFFYLAELEVTIALAEREFLDGNHLL